MHPQAKAKHVHPSQVASRDWGSISPTLVRLTDD